MGSTCVLSFACVFLLVCVGVCIELLYQPAAHSGQIVSQITLSALDAVQTASQAELCCLHTVELSKKVQWMAVRKKTYILCVCIAEYVHVCVPTQTFFEVGILLL